MIDLHMHTVHSDGTDTVKELLIKAENIGLSYISITDHDTCKAYEALQDINIQDYYKGKIIVGCELTTTLKGNLVEILGYGVDYKYINDLVENQWYNEQQLTDMKFNLMLEMLNENKDKIKYNEDIIRKEYNNKFAGSPIHDELTRHKENKKYFKSDATWDNEFDFYRYEITNDDSMFFTAFDSLYPSFNEIIDIIHKDGGKAFLAHPYVYAGDKLRIMEASRELGVDGIECYHSAFSYKEMKTAEEFCIKNNLYLSGGSDYHGERKKNINLGIGKGNLNINDCIVETWVKDTYLYEASPIL